MTDVREPTDNELIEAGRLLWRQGNGSMTEAVMMLRSKNEVEKPIRCDRCGSSDLGPSSMRGWRCRGCGFWNAGVQQGGTDA